MSDKVKIGDEVRHNDRRVNSGVLMTVQNVRIADEITQVYLEYFNPEAVHKKDWFNLSDCEVIKR